MVVEHTAEELLNRARHAAAERVRRSRGVPADKMLTEMALTIEANAATIVSHNTPDASPALTPTDITAMCDRLKESATQIASTPSGQVTMPDHALSTSEAVEAFAHAAATGGSVLITAAPNQAGTTAYVIDLIRRRMQQLGWNSDMVAIVR